MLTGRSEVYETKKPGKVSKRIDIELTDLEFESFHFMVLDMFSI